jgi:hypothetical protein
MIYRYKEIYTYDLLPHHISADRNTLLKDHQYCRQFYISKKSLWKTLKSSYTLSLRYATNRLELRK